MTLEPRHLSPELLAFQSFRHSQGSPTAQLNIFSYMDIEFDLQPHFESGPKEVDRYAEFLKNAAQTGTHMDVRLYRSAAFATLIGISNDVKHSLPARYLNRDRVIAELSGSLTSQERRLLDPNPPDRSAINGITPENRRQRMARRAAEGQTSFIEYYGRDSHSTGYIEFDKMYADVWDHLSD